MTREEMLADLTYARTLAEEGRHAPLIGGSYFLLFGLLLSPAYALQWAVLEQVVAIPINMIGVIWIVFGALAALGSMLLTRSVRSKPGGSAIPNRVDRNIWQGVVWAILTVVTAAVLRAVYTQDFTAPDIIVAAGFGLYGVALYATGTIGGHAWLRGFAFLAWAVSGTLWFFLHEPWTYLLAAIASLAVLAVPGFIMVRREPTAIV